MQREAPGPIGGRDEALDAQLAGVRARLVRDAAEVGIDEPTVLAAIEKAAAYADAPVRTLLAVLIEGDVRCDLGISARSI